MKIAYLFSRYPVPSQTFCDTEIRALEAAGHEVEIHSCSAPTSSFRHGGPADWPRAEVLYAPPGAVLEAWAVAAQRDGAWPAEMIADHLARFGPRYDPARRARHALYFADRLRRRGVGHVHVHFANRATHAALFIHALTGVPFSFTAHAQDFLVDLGNDDLLRLLCERAAFVVAVSDWSRQVLVERCPAAAAKLHRVYNGLPLELWPLPASAPQELAATGLKIFSVGRLVEFKGFQDLIAACGLLRERGVQFSCEIAGEGPLRATLEAQTAGFTDPAARVRLTGLLTQQEVRGRMEACDVFSLACRVDEKGACDVLPTVILEAMASAKPVISTRLAGVPEMVAEARTGLLVPPGDPLALADALATLAADERSRQRMGAAGCAEVRGRFSVVDSVRQLEELFARARAAPPFVSTKALAPEQASSVCCLFDQWPLESQPGKAFDFDAMTLLELQRTLPGVKLIALKAGQFPDGVRRSGDDSETLRAFEFLPDAVVLETGWRKDEALAHRLESRRGEIGGSGDADAFLVACRRALYLHRTLLSEGKGCWHVQAVGPSALWCVALWQRLHPMRTASFLLPPQPGGGCGVAGSTLRKLAPGFAGGWVIGERKLAATLGANFRGDAFDTAGWTRAVADYDVSCVQQKVP